MSLYISRLCFNVRTAQDQREFDSIWADTLASEEEYAMPKASELKKGMIVEIDGFPHIVKTLKQIAVLKGRFHYL